MDDLSPDERNSYLLTKRAAGLLVLEETNAVRQGVGQIRAIVADAIAPLARAVEAMDPDADPDAHRDAVRSLQFADMVEQLGAYCDAELDNVVQLARDLNQIANDLMSEGPDAHPRLIAFQHTLDERLNKLRERLADRGHKAVVQENMDEGDIELF